MNIKNEFYLVKKVSLRFKKVTEKMLSASKSKSRWIKVDGFSLRAPLFPQCQHMVRNKVIKHKPADFMSSD